MTSESTERARQALPLWQVGLPILHYLFGASLLFCSLLFHYRYADIVDFYTYYHAAVVMLQQPQNLYHSELYALPYNPQHYVPFNNPPSFALFIYPLGFFSYPAAWSIWIGINLIASIAVIFRVRTLAESLGLQKYKNLLGAVAVGIPSWVYIMHIGQVSVILALAITSFLVHWRSGEHKAAAFWIAVGAAIKPHYFVFLLLFLLGCRQCKCVMHCAAWFGLFALISVALLGYQLWPAYVYHILEMNHHSEGFASFFERMVNLRGILTASLSSDHGEWVTRLIFTLYGLGGIGCLMLGCYAHAKQAKIEAFVPLVFALSWFLAPWLHMQDCYSLLPVITLLLAYLTPIRRSYLLLPIYVLMTLFGFAGFWPYRLSLLLLVCISASIAFRRAEIAS